jgi:hypothetical protein
VCKTLLLHIFYSLFIITCVNESGPHISVHVFFWCYNLIVCNNRLIVEVQRKNGGPLHAR